MSHPNSPLTFEGKRRLFEGKRRLFEGVDAGRPVLGTAAVVLERRRDALDITLLAGSRTASTSRRINVLAPDLLDIGTLNDLDRRRYRPAT